MNNPASVEAIRTGVKLLEAGRLADAEDVGRRALQLDPKNPHLLYMLGGIASETRDFEAAVDWLQRAVRYKKDDPNYYIDLGTALCSLRRDDEAVACFKKVLRLQSNNARAHGGIGYILHSQGKQDAAAARYRQALKCDPKSAGAHTGLGAVLQAQGQHNEAILCYQRALECDPKCAEAHGAYASLLIRRGFLGETIHHLKEAIALKPHLTGAYGSLLLCLQYMPGASNALMLELARRWEQSLPRLPAIAPWRNTRRAERTLRVGYVSGDFRTHSVAHFIESVFRTHDRSAVELFCYSTKEHADEVNARLKATASGWREIGALSDDAAARLVRDDGIDILVDLSGHTQGHRLGLFARKPAPLQCTWLGYVGTTGLETIDYIIADRFVIPPEDERFYAEAVYRLPGSYLCFTPPVVPIEVAPLPSLQGAPITFGSCNSLYKLTEHVLDLWARILLAVPGSRLLLKNYHLTKPVFADQIIGRLAQSGIGADRLLLADAAERHEILATYNTIDIALDPFPYGGGTTTAEALWMGVPVITWRGDRFVGRVSESILTIAGMSEFVATSAEEYVAKAVGLAADPPALAGLRAGLRDRLVQSPMCDAVRFTRDLEDAYRTMWTRWCDAGEQRGAA
jgi:predicted O-linked N-acetylglucosamine transferase (SPINDLY family)